MSGPICVQKAQGVRDVQVDEFHPTAFLIPLIPGTHNLIPGDNSW